MIYFHFGHHLNICGCLNKNKKVDGKKSPAIGNGEMWHLIACEQARRLRIQKHHLKVSIGSTALDTTIPKSSWSILWVTGQHGNGFLDEDRSSFLGGKVCITKYLLWKGKVDLIALIYDYCQRAVKSRRLSKFQSTNVCTYIYLHLFSGVYIYCVLYHVIVPRLWYSSLSHQGPKIICSYL